MQAKNSYIFSNSPQQNSIQNQIETFWIKKGRPEYPISLQTLLNGIRFRIKLKTFWIKKAGQKFLQTFLNEIRFRIKLKVSEWKMQTKNSYISNSP